MEAEEILIGSLFLLTVFMLLLDGRPIMVFIATIMVIGTILIAFYIKIKQVDEMFNRGGEG